MRWKSYSPYILAVALVGLSGGVLAAVAGDTASVDRMAAEPAPEAAVAPTLASALGPAALPAAGLLLSAPGPAPYHWFPNLYSPTTAAQASDGPADVPDEDDLLRRAEERSAYLPMLANNMILAFYGKPDSKRMGILGEYSMEDLAKLLKGYEKLYEDVSGSKGVVGAYYLIYGTCWPGGDIGYLKDSVVQDYIDYAAREGMLVFIDHQIGRYSVAEAVRRLLPFLKYPNVHLALDPEWRTTSPMKEVGTISADELNDAQAMIEDYLDRERIPGVKMLVVHQFNGRMIEDRGKVRANFERVILIHTADGFGPPALKRSSYAYNALATNMPLKGFKLFFKSTMPGAGFDEPLLTPAEVLSLDPRPCMVIYQ
ncbi:MAG: hypothetical protein ACLQMF_15965 [Rectinemataceae bacterium]